MRDQLMKSVVLGLVAGFVGFGSLHAQQKSSFKVSGPCVACGAGRVEGIAKGIDGVSVASYNASTSMLTIDFNPVAASLVDIQLELSLQGYDAGDFSRDAKAKLPACAGGGGMRGDQASDDLDEPGIDDIDGLEADTDWENPDAFDVAGNSGDNDDIDLLGDDADDDADLSTWADDDKNNDDFGGTIDIEDDEDDL
jgi:hypothetical protein